MTERKKKIKYVVEIAVEGFADELPFFQEVADEHITHIRLDAASSRVCKDGVVRTATCRFEGSKIVSREIVVL
ncbi:MAG: hypothetical protein PHC39_04760 [Proteiniphilum sp.]|nr:hypothetical protein [Proteiniphilum sp.]